MKKMLDLIWILMSALLAGGYLYFASIANFDLTDGRFALFMDEKVTFDGVQKILYPESFQSFIFNIYNGRDHRYGRSLWNSIALFSFLPAYLYEVQGQIISARMLQVLLLMSSFQLLGMALLKTWKYRFFLFLLLLSLPFTDYYSTMPKPEPLQLLFLSLFLYYYMRSGMKFREKYWILLGLALGTKISILPVILILAVWTVWGELKKQPLAILLDNLVKAFGYFLAGLALAVPILVPTFMIGTLIYMGTLYLMMRIRKTPSAKLLWVKVFLLAGIFAGSIVLAYLNYIKGGKSGIASWGGAMIMNAKNAADLPSINFFSWIKYISTVWIASPIWFTYFLGLTYVVFLLSISKKFFIALKQWVNMNFLFAAVLMTAGALLCVSIMMTVHRLWGFYLFIGAILFVTGLISLIEQCHVMNNNSYTATGRKTNNYPLFALVLALALLALFWVPDSINSYRSLASRTKTEVYKNNYASYVLVDSVLNDQAKKLRKKLSVSIDPELFVPVSNSSYTMDEFWGPFIFWNSSYDIVILGETHLPGKALFKTESALYNDFLKERDGYDSFVVEKNQKCKQAFCYERVLRLPNGGEILVLKHLSGS